jgi:Domain of unknown function (DUF5916)/Carbohydrate family 9 binding domain-like
MKLLLTISLLIVATITFGQTIDVANYQQQYQLHIFKKTTDIKIDGVLDEGAWNLTEKADNFWLKFPKDDAHADHKTEIRVCYDDKFLYIGATLHDKKPFIGQSLKRDSRIRENDGLGIVLDPINKKTNGFYFSVTAFNVQADDVLGASNDDLSFSWDNKWYSQTKQYDDKLTIEVAIPFKTLRFDNANLNWGINFIRSDRKANQFHTWTRIPLNFRAFDIGYTGALVWDKAPSVNGKNIAFIPYVTQNVVNDKSNGNTIDGKFNTGFDAKVALTGSMNLDLTVNPDFSQVEVDQQVTNLSRFNIAFPERRNFFLENSDLYSDYGIPPIRPFYSRTIGLDNEGRTIPILFGARVTGNLTSKMRVGVLNMQTKATNNFAAQNYTAISAQQRILKRSTIKGYFLNRTGFYNDKNKLIDTLNQYGRNAGIETNYTSQSGKYEGWAGYHHSMKPNINTLNGYLNYGLGYKSRTISSFFYFDHVGVNYYTDMGFVERIESTWSNTDSVVRNGFKSVFNQTEFNIFPKKSKLINQHKFTLENFYVLNPNNTFNERNNELSYNISFKNSSFVKLSLSNQSVKLLAPASFTNEAPLPIAQYDFSQVSVGAQTDDRKKFVVGGGFTLGKFYSATYKKYTARFIYRYQPKFTFEMNVEYNDLIFPSGFGKANLFLIAPRIEINFTNNLFWTTFIQYNTQRNNLNFNSRLQWRYKPVSDLFLVYTDNYFTDPLFKNKNRALVFKLNYWLNL